MVSSLLLLAATTIAPQSFAPEDWKPITSEAVKATIRTEASPYGPAARIDFDFNKQGGFVLAEIARKIELDPNYEFTFMMKAKTPVNDFEFKLMDEKGDSVWWVKKQAYRWPTEWTRMSIRKSHFRYGWGPKRELFDTISAFQLGIAAFDGGKGTVWIAQPEIRPAPVPKPFSTDLTLVSGNLESQTRSTAVFDRGDVRPLGGLQIEHGARANVLVELSNDGENWTSPRLAVDSLREAIFDFPDGEARYLRLTTNPHAGQTVRLSNIQPLPSEVSMASYSILEWRARNQPAGLYPLHFWGKMNWLTVTGGLKSDHEAGMSEIGQVELGKMEPSLEPFVWVDNRLMTWANSSPVASQPAGGMPIPAVAWHGPVKLTTSALTSEDGTDSLMVRYRVLNTSKSRKQGRLYVAARPFQVNPSWQQLNITPLVAPIETLRADRQGFTLNGSTKIRSLTPANLAGATTFAAGDVQAWMLENQVPPKAAVQDPEGRAAGLLAYNFDLAPGEEKTYTLVRTRTGSGPQTTAAADRAWTHAESAWRKALGAPKIQLSGKAQLWSEVYQAQLAYILVHRDGPMIHPGSRTYPRTWIRDGSLTATALLQAGKFKEVKELIEWFSPYVRADGWVPCVVDRRGADPLAEHDSHGQYLFLLAEYYRMTGDLATIRKHYPTARRVANKIISLRRERMTPEFRDATDIKRGFYGLFPQSASHEGYMDIHRHSYWDDFFGVKGLHDAASLARLTGNSREAQTWTSEAAAFEKDIVSSIRFAQQHHNVSYIPGCVELGDFDATSTAIGVYPCEAQRYVPASMMDPTFNRYWQFFQDRAANRIDWRDYTPYEVRVLGAMVLLGQPERAWFMMDWFSRDLLPRGWHQWAEVGYKDQEPGRWYGDMPHTWVGSDYMKSLRLMMVHEQEGGLVFGLGVNPAWLKEPGGVKVTHLPTAFGPVSYTATAKGSRAEYRISGSLKRSPKLWLSLPAGARTPRVNGKAVSAHNGRVAIAKLPATVHYSLSQP